MSSVSSSPRANGALADGRRIEVGGLAAVPRPSGAATEGAPGEAGAKSGAFAVRAEERGSGAQRAERMHVPVHAGKAAPARKAPYVPGIRGGKASTQTIELGQEELASTAAGYFRSVAWDGTIHAPAAPRALEREALAFDANTPVRIAFASVAWTGTTAAPATAAQSKTSVESVLKRFRWE